MSSNNNKDKSNKNGDLPNSYLFQPIAFENLTQSMHQASLVFAMWGVKSE